jgi:hypothetical protein
MDRALRTPPVRGRRPPPNAENQAMVQRAANGRVLDTVQPLKKAAAVDWGHDLYTPDVASKGGCVLTRCTVRSATASQSPRYKGG